MQSLNAPSRSTAIKGDTKALPGEVQPTTTRGGEVSKPRQALELRAESGQQSGAADCPLFAG
ncbi:hypothetical protein Syn8016DRAFT_1139 [Synechococcus sp. WH 8016]|nr:hypothetical protein Syn8016DRAFT_1139 [Synechococcus sp. WH 8016]